MYENNYPNNYNNTSTEQGSVNHNTYQYGTGGSYGSSGSSFQGGSTYQQSSNTGKAAKKKNGSGFGKKIAIGICCGLCFGIFAGVGFQAVTTATDFLKGKINVNQIAKEIKNTYNTSSYNAKRLVTTEVSRCHNESFRRFCYETGVKKVIRNAILDNKTCTDCAEHDGEIYDIGKMPDVSHPMCRCFYEVYE